MCDVVYGCGGVGAHKNQPFTSTTCKIHTYTRSPDFMICLVSRNKVAARWHLAAGSCLTTETIPSRGMLFRAMCENRAPIFLSNSMQMMCWQISRMHKFR